MNEGLGELRVSQTLFYAQIVVKIKLSLRFVLNSKGDYVSWQTELCSTRPLIMVPEQSKKS